MIQVSVQPKAAFHGYALHRALTFPGPLSLTLLISFICNSPAYLSVYLLDMNLMGQRQANILGSVPLHIMDSTDV